MYIRRDGDVGNETDSDDDTREDANDSVDNASVSNRNAPRRERDTEEGGSRFFRSFDDFRRMLPQSIYIVNGDLRLDNNGGNSRGNRVEIAIARDRPQSSASDAPVVFDRQRAANVDAQLEALAGLFLGRPFNFTHNRIVADQVQGVQQGNASYVARAAVAQHDNAVHHGSAESSRSRSSAPNAANAANAAMLQEPDDISIEHVAVFVACKLSGIDTANCGITAELLPEVERSFNTACLLVLSVSPRDQGADVILRMIMQRAYDEFSKFVDRCRMKQIFQAVKRRRQGPER